MSQSIAFIGVAPATPLLLARVLAACSLGWCEARPPRQQEHRAPVDDVVATMTSMAPCSAFALQDRRGASSLKAMLLLRGAAGSALGVVGGQWYPCRRRAANMSGVLIPVM